MTMVESLASGKPVIALGRGGVLEIVGQDYGVLYPDWSVASLGEALREFDRIGPSLSPLNLSRQAQRLLRSGVRREFPFRAFGKGLAFCRTGVRGGRGGALSEFTRCLHGPNDTRRFPFLRSGMQTESLVGRR